MIDLLNGKIMAHLKTESVYETIPVLSFFALATKFSVLLTTLSSILGILERNNLPMTQITGVMLRYRFKSSYLLKLSDIFSSWISFQRCNTV